MEIPDDINMEEARSQVHLALDRLTHTVDGQLPEARELCGDDEEEDDEQMVLPTRALQLQRPCLLGATMTGHNTHYSLFVMSLGCLSTPPCVLRSSASSWRTTMSPVLCRRGQAS